MDLKIPIGLNPLKLCQFSPMVSFKVKASCYQTLPPLSRCFCIINFCIVNDRFFLLMVSRLLQSFFFKKNFYFIWVFNLYVEGHNA